MDYSPLRVFISYTAEDLQKYADVVVDVVQRLEWIPVDHRKWSPSGRPSVKECLEKVAGADILVVLVAHRYGWVPTRAEGGDDRTSITWLEVNWARKFSKEVLPYIVKPNAAWPYDKIEGVANTDIMGRLEAFKSELRQTLAGFFSEDPTSIRETIDGALREAANRIRGRNRQSTTASFHNVTGDGLAAITSEDSEQSTRAIRIVLHPHYTSPNVTLKLTPAQASGGLVIEIVTEGEHQGKEAAPTSPPPKTVEVADDDIVSLEFADGSERFLTSRDLRDKFGTGEVDLGRASAGGGDVDAWIIKALKVLRIDDASLYGSGKVPREMAFALERRFKPTPGIYQFSDPDTVGALATSPTIADDHAPLLIFVHGPGMSNTDTFRDLRNDTAWNTIRGVYGDRLLAYEHHTISVSPIANALECARWLPPESMLHMITHSRGGLVAELLCLPPNTAQESEAIISPLRRALSIESDKAQQSAIEEDIENIRELLSLRARKRWRVTRFLRIACPARGITMDRLDHYLSLLLSLSSSNKAVGSDELLKVLTLTVVKNRISFQDLPGLAAQLPNAPLIGILNDPRWSSDADLNVVGGRLSLAGTMPLLQLAAADAYYTEEGDGLIAHSSISGGLRRQKPAPEWYEGRNCSHFRFFESDLLCQHIADWLTEGSGNFGGRDLVSR